MTTFGILSIFACLMVLWLPETLNSSIPQTAEDMNKAKEYHGLIWMGRRVLNPLPCFRWAFPQVRVVSQINVSNNEILLPLLCGLHKVCNHVSGEWGCIVLRLVFRFPTFQWRTVGLLLVLKELRRDGWVDLWSSSFYFIDRVSSSSYKRYSLDVAPLIHGDTEETEFLGDDPHIIRSRRWATK